MDYAILSSAHGSTYRFEVEPDKPTVFHDLPVAVKECQFFERFFDTFGARAKLYERSTGKTIDWIAFPEHFLTREEFDEMRADLRRRTAPGYRGDLVRQ